MNSYESSKWQIKLWRKRWYLYATFLFFLKYVDIELCVDLWVEYLFSESISDKKKLKLRKNWNDIKRHVELTKMCKYTSSSYNKHDDD
jgi:hypothetical protein